MRNTYLHYITVYPTVVPTLNPFKCITKIQLISPPPPLIKVDFKLEKEEISFSEEEGIEFIRINGKNIPLLWKIKFSKLLQVSSFVSLFSPLSTFHFHVSFLFQRQFAPLFCSHWLILFSPPSPSFMQPFIFNELQDSIYLFPSLSSSHALLSRFSLLKSINKKKET